MNGIKDDVRDVSKTCEDIPYTSVKLYVESLGKDAKDYITNDNISFYIDVVNEINRILAQSGIRYGIYES